MKISVHAEVLNLLPTIRLGTISATINCEPSSNEFIASIDDLAGEIRDQYNLEEIKNHEVIASTRNAYKKFGNDPNRYRPSADALLRRIVKDSDLYRINNVVDTLNLISIQSGFSIGGYDADKIEDSIEIGNW